MKQLNTFGAKKIDTELTPPWEWGIEAQNQQ
jgi:hypothetical protein